MEVNIKGFVRNVVSNVLEKLLEQECLFDSFELLTDEDDEHFQIIMEIAKEVTEQHLDCIIEEQEPNDKNPIYKTMEDLGYEMYGRETINWKKDKFVIHRHPGGRYAKYHNGNRIPFEPLEMLALAEYIQKFDGGINNV